MPCDMSPGNSHCGFSFGEAASPPLPTLLPPGGKVTSVLGAAPYLPCPTLSESPPPQPCPVAPGASGTAKSLPLTATGSRNRRTFIFCRHCLLVALILLSRLF